MCAHFGGPIRPKRSLDVPRPHAGPPPNAWLISISPIARTCRELRPPFPTLGHSLVEQIATQFRSADGLALDQIQIHSPFAEKMKYNLYSALVIITAHNRRHLWQADRALQGV